MSTTLRLWHGGAAGKRPGDIITAGGETRGDTGTVLVTTDRDYARQFAANVPLGDLYRVEQIPDFDIERADGHSIETYRAPAVRVLSVYDRAVRMRSSERRRLRETHRVAMAAARQQEQSA